MNCSAYEDLKSKQIYFVAGLDDRAQLYYRMSSRGLRLHEASAMVNRMKMVTLVIF